MILAGVDSSKPHHVKASQNFQRLLLELAIRNDNYHVGSGLGGNNFQFICLLNIKHELKDQVFTNYIPKDCSRVEWDARSLSENNVRGLRADVDAIVSVIPEKNKYHALLWMAMKKSPNLREAFKEHKDYFPNLANFLGGHINILPDNLAPMDQLIVASILCQELANELDEGKSPNLFSIAKQLSKFDMSVNLYATRNFIGINRLVKYNMDEDEHFGPMVCDAINKLVD